MIGLWMTILTCAAVVGAAWAIPRLMRALRPRLVARAGRLLGLGTAERLPFNPTLVFADDAILGLRSAARTSILQGMHQGRHVTLYEQTHEVMVQNRPVRMTRRIVIMAAPTWPVVTLEPRHGRPARTGVRPGLQLEDRRFNRRCMVQASDDDFAIYLLTPALQQGVVRDRPRACWRLGGGFIARSEVGPLRPRDVARMIQSVDRLLEHIPEALRDEFRRVPMAQSAAAGGDRSVGSHASRAYDRALVPIV